jgi:hypothetical protein
MVAEAARNARGFASTKQDGRLDANEAAVQVCHSLAPRGRGTFSTQAIAFTRAASREILREAVFLCTTPP